MYDRVAVIDYGKGDAVGLARSIRSRGIYSRIFPYTVSKERLAECKPKLIIHATDKEFERTNLAPEVTYPSTDLNEVLLSHVQANWTMERYAEDLIQQIRETVGRKNVLLGLSGGVDSSVCALLIHKAVGDRLKCVFVDHGLLRKDEGAAVYYLLDRPFYILDELDTALTYHSALTMIRHLQRNGAGILIITHDQQFITRTGGRIYQIEEGRVSER